MSQVRTVRLGRRRALQIFGAGLAASGLAGLGACGKESAPGSTEQPGAAPAAAGPSCDSAIAPEAAQTRATLQYKDVAAVPEKHCAVCAQYIEAKFGECGGCNLFDGPVKPNGGCLAFAPKGAPAAPADPAAPAAPAAPGAPASAPEAPKQPG